MTLCLRNSVVEFCAPGEEVGEETDSDGDEIETGKV